MTAAHLLGSAPRPALRADMLRQRAGVAAVSLRGLTKRFSVRRGWRETLTRPRGAEYAVAVDELTLDVEPAELFGLLGPNGAGKTTLFKMLATLVLPDAGEARIVGHDLLREPAAVRRVLTPVVADERSLFWRLSARENLLLYARLQGLRGDAAHARVAQLLGVVELEASADAPMVGKFSSGMKQRLLIARALVLRPRVLLLDEPTRSLDPIAARRLRAFLREEIVGREGCTVLLATHSAEEAFELCDRVGVLHRGRLLATGAAAALAREAGQHRYRIWTTATEHRLLLRLHEEGVLRRGAVHPPDADGWPSVEVEVDGGAPVTADLLARLVDAGAPVARFERVHLSLAELIDRLVERQDRGAR